MDAVLGLGAPPHGVIRARGGAVGVLVVPLTTRQEPQALHARRPGHPTALPHGVIGGRDRAAGVLEAHLPIRREAHPLLATSEE